MIKKTNQTQIFIKTLESMFFPFRFISNGSYSKRISHFTDLSPYECTRYTYAILLTIFILNKIHLSSKSKRARPRARDVSSENALVNQLMQYIYTALIAVIVIRYSTNAGTDARAFVNSLIFYNSKTSNAEFGLSKWFRNLI